MKHYKCIEQYSKKTVELLDYLCKNCNSNWQPINYEINVLVPICEHCSKDFLKLEKKDIESYLEKFELPRQYATVYRKFRSLEELEGLILKNDCPHKEEYTPMQPMKILLAKTARSPVPAFNDSVYFSDDFRKAARYMVENLKKGPWPVKYMINEVAAACNNRQKDFLIFTVEDAEEYMLYLIQEKELKPVSVRNCGVRLQYIQNYVREHFREIGIDILEKKPIPYIQMYKDGVTQRLQAHESLIGKPFGLLKVIGKDSSKDKDARRVWKCVCKCGNVVYASRTELTHGYRTHCGDREKHNGKELWQGE